MTNEVMRYSFFVSEDESGSPYVDDQEDPEYGQWVKYDDIKHLLHPEPEAPRAEPFVVKHYAGEAHPSIKGNGFDGLTLGNEREEAQEFVDWVNARLALNRRGES